MICQDARLVAVSADPGRLFTVGAQTLLSEIIQQDAAASGAYLLVEDELGHPIGVADVADLRRRTASPNAAEQRRWLDTPVEMTLSGRIQVQHRPTTGTVGEIDAEPSSCTIVRHDGRLLAVLTQDDLLLSWRSIENTLRHARNDSLTMLPNRTMFDDYLRAECCRALRFRHSVGVILIDVDHFKTINDRFGHAAGDSVLTAVGKALRRSLRSYDLVARYGGDEFAVICCGCLPGEIDVTLQRLRQEMNQIHEELTIPHPVPTVSMGACVIHEFGHGECPDSILQLADECLYAAKRSGRNCTFSTEICEAADSVAPLRPVLIG